MTQQQGSNVNRSQRKESLTRVNSGIMFIWRKQIANIFVHWFQDANPLWLIIFKRFTTSVRLLENEF